MYSLALLQALIHLTQWQAPVRVFNQVISYFQV